MQQRRLFGVTLVAGVAGWVAACGAGAAGEGAGKGNGHFGVRRDPPGLTAATLVGTYWRLWELPGAPLAGGGRMVTPYLTLQAGDPLIASGHGGCNRFNGTATRTGDRGLKFEGLMSTRMACADGMAGEMAFFAALEATRGFVIERQLLTLTSEAGRAVASFQADLLR